MRGIELMEAAVTPEQLFDVIKRHGESDEAIRYSRMSTSDIASRIGVGDATAYKLLKAAEKAGYVKSAANTLKRQHVAGDPTAGVGYAFWEVYWDETGAVKNQIKPKDDPEMVARRAIIAAVKQVEPEAVETKDGFSVKIPGGSLPCAISAYYGQLQIIPKKPKDDKTRPRGPNREVIDYHMKKLKAVKAEAGGVESAATELAVAFAAALRGARGVKSS
jgi:hypothetical protein